MAKAHSELEGCRIGFIGCGAMARALAGGLIEAGIPASQILGADPFPSARDQFAEAIGATTTDDNHQVVSNSDIVILATKPGAIAGLLSALDASICEKPLWVSIAAGVGNFSIFDVEPSSTNERRASLKRHRNDVLLPALRN